MFCLIGTVEEDTLVGGVLDGVVGHLGGVEADGAGELTQQLNVKSLLCSSRTK